MKNKIIYILSLCVNYMLTSVLWGIHYRFGKLSGMKEDAILSLILGLPVAILVIIIFSIFTGKVARKYEVSETRSYVIGNIIFSMGAVISICLILWGALSNLHIGI